MGAQIEPLNWYVERFLAMLWFERGRWFDIEFVIRWSLE